MSVMFASGRRPVRRLLSSVGWYEVRNLVSCAIEYKLRLRNSFRAHHVVSPDSRGDSGSNGVTDLGKEQDEGSDGGDFLMRDARCQEWEKDSSQ
jgi:hypothetical protein